MPAGYTVLYNGKSYMTLDGALSASAKDVTRPFRDLGAMVREEMLAVLEVVAEKVIASFKQGTRNNPKNAVHLRTRTGYAVRSIKRSVKVSTEGRRLYIGKVGGTDYLNVHEDGAIVYARGSKYLTVPLSAAKDARGVPLKARARDWGNTFVARNKKGNLIIYQKRGRSMVPLYILVRSVYIPPRLGMEKRLNIEAEGFVRNVLNRGAEILANG